VIIYYIFVCANRRCLSNALKFVFYHALQIILLVPTNNFINYRCAVWIEHCKSINLPTTDPDILNRNHRLCSLHFEDKMYANVKKTRLSNEAIPTIFKSKLVLVNHNLYYKTIFCFFR